MEIEEMNDFLPKKKKKLITLEKQDLLLERNELLNKIMKRTNKALYENYLDIKRIIKINQELEGKELIDFIAEKLKCETSYIKYLLRFDNLKNKEWLTKINANIILLTLSFNDDSENRQDEHFKYFEDHDYDINKVRVHLIKEYIKDKDLIKEHHFLYEKISRAILLIKDNIFIAKKSTMTSKEKKELVEKVEELNQEIKEII